MNNQVKFEDMFLPDEFTTAQKDAVKENGEVIVSAAAGSGKTTAMIKRILRLLFDGISLKDMLILVFNNSAASELREKLHKAILQICCELDGELQAFFKKQLDELAFAHISTIHAYCQSLIKENFNFLGISPSFEVLDENANKEYMDVALDNIFDAYDKEGDETFEKIAQAFSSARKEDNLKANIVKLFNDIDIQNDKNKFFDNVSECYQSFEGSKFFEIIIQSEHDFFRRAEGVLLPCLEVFEKGAEADNKYSKYRDKIVNAVYYAQRLANTSDFDEMCKIACEFEDCYAKNQGFEEVFNAYAKIAAECIKAMKEEMGMLGGYANKTEFLKTAHKQNGELIEKLIEITSRFAKEYARLKEEDNVLSFADLENKAKEFLSCENNSVQKFKQVFVDEYQDVNPTQEYIISKLVDGNCFMVGDIKQSIYAFRLADPENFSNRQERYESGEGTAIYFNRNFRSAKQILQVVNGVFDVVMTKDSAGVDYKNTARFDLEEVKDGGVVELHLFNIEKPAQQTAVGVYDITGDVEAEEPLTSSDAEGIFVANKIKELVGRVKKDDGKYLEYGDISIIAKSRSTGAKRVINQLKKAGIPLDDGNFDTSTSKPEKELMLLLRSIDNPRQDIPFAGFLLSFFGGYSEQELATIAAVDAETFYDKFLICSTFDDELARKIRETKKMLDVYRIKASFKNVKDLMGGIVSDFSYDAYLMKNGSAAVYGLKAFISSVSDKDNDSLGKFLRNYGESESKSQAQSNCDRVHVSTFHRYKGLENEVVFLVDLGNGFSSQDIKGDILVNPKGYIGLNYFDFDNKEKSSTTISRLAVKKIFDKKTVGEAMRLMYVAMTRAKRFMYLTASVSKEKTTDFGKTIGIKLQSSMLDFIETAKFHGLDIDVFAHRNNEYNVNGAQKTTFVFPPANKDLQEKIENVQRFEYAHKNATKLAIKYSVSALDSLDEQTVSAYADGDFKHIGTTYHKIMQYIDFFAEGIDGVKAEINRLINEKYISEEEIAIVREVDGDRFEQKIATCLASKLIEDARKCEKKGRCLREKAFMMYKPAKEVHEDFDTDEKVLVQGVIDLFIDGDKKIIVDFKNSDLKDKNTLEKYKQQLKLYKMAVESSICAKVDEIVLYSFKTGDTVKISI